MKALGMLALVVGVLIALFGIEVRERNTSMCATCGALRHQSIWLNRWHNSPSIIPSPMEARIIKIEGSHAHDWQYLQGLSSTLIGAGGSRSCGSAPRIFDMYSFIDRFAVMVTDEQIADYLNVVRHGTDDEHDAAVRAALEQAFRSEQRE